ncbi:DUF6671 family protein [Thermomonas sp.]|uniref:DUF6671 family protein n=1 Tax=Thermomonas sp. TaxID=1971895 RepID=UPI002488603A|nr:DUF6671 family protein [Thermomonas sp.]MDI1254107.1 hypothetical protein [Thermomonas sp.]
MKAISDHPYLSQRVALLTQHGKQQVIAPALHAAVGCKVERVAGIDTDLLGTFARQWRFPGHRMVVRPACDGDSRIRKGIASWEQLERHFRWARQTSTNGQVFIETDMRADANPSRMNVIRSAAIEPGQRLACSVPAVRFRASGAFGLCPDCPVDYAVKPRGTPSQRYWRACSATTIASVNAPTCVSRIRLTVTSVIPDCSLLSPLAPALLECADDIDRSCCPAPVRCPDDGLD